MAQAKSLFSGHSLPLQCVRLHDTSSLRVCFQDTIFLRSPALTQCCCLGSKHQLTNCPANVSQNASSNACREMLPGPPSLVPTRKGSTGADRPSSLPLLSACDHEIFVNTTTRRSAATRQFPKGTAEGTRLTAHQINIDRNSKEGSIAVMTRPVPTESGALCSAGFSQLVLLI